MLVNFKLNNKTAIISLDRPSALNATNTECIELIDQYLNKALELNLEKIIITSEHEKFFCSGGDIKAIYYYLLHNNKDSAMNFFNKEYDLVYKIATFPIPIITLVNGICFGGGMGLSMHNKLKIITPTTRLAMPETLIGFFPDVGASFAFKKFKKAMARFYLYTSLPIDLYHCIKYKIIDYCIEYKNFNDLLKSNADDLDEDFFKKHHIDLKKTIDLKKSYLEIFEQPLSTIFKELQNTKDLFLQNIFENLKNKSLLSLKVCEKLLDYAFNYDLKQSLELDKILAYNFLDNLDFINGIKERLIDKDNQYNWIYKDIEKINEINVDNLFIDKSILLR